MGSLIELSAIVGRVLAARHFKLATVESCLSLKLLRYLAGLLIFLLATTVTFAQHYEAGQIHILSPWARALPPTSPNGAVYLTLTNHGAHPDTLLGASADIAEHVEVHSHILEDGMMKMRRVESVDLPPHKEVLFAPSGHHIMLIGLKQPLAAGDRFSLLLTFEQTEQALVEVVVQMADTQGAGQTHLKHDQTGSVAANDPGPVKRFELYIQHGKILTDERTIRVSQGDQVELYWSSDKPDVLHLHGYDIHTKVTPHVPAVMQFKAHASGRFPVESHGHSGHGRLIYLEVHPQ
jgi:hypothetical protein